MKLGFLTSCMPERTLEQIAAWAAEADFEPATLTSNTFEMEWPPKSGKRATFPEVDRAEWFELEPARQKINPAQADLLDSLTALVDS